MRRVPWWGLVSAGAAPVLLIGGWTLAAARQPAGYDATTDTISALAGLGANDRWVVTCALLGLGLCHVVTALALRGVAGRTGIALLALGGLSTVAVAAFPLPVSGASGAHAVAAAVAFGALAVWPFGAVVQGHAPWPLRPWPARTAGLVLALLVGWFAVALASATDVGLAERVAAGSQALWPLAVVVGTRVSLRAGG